MLYFDSNMTGCRLIDCSLGSQYNFISDAYTANSVTASRSMNAFRYFSDARFNLYTDDFEMHKNKCITKHLLNASIFRFI